MNFVNFSNNSTLILEKKYWLSKLANIMPTTYLPQNEQVDKDGNSVKKELPFTIDAEVSAKILKVSRNTDIKVFSILAAALKTMMYHYDYRLELDTLVWSLPQRGPETNTASPFFALRDTVHGQLSFKELLIAVDKSIAEAHNNSNSSFLDILKQLEINLEKGARLSEIGILLENIHSRDAMEYLPGTLCFVFKRAGEMIQGIAAYQEDVYEAKTVEKYINHYLNVLGSVMGNLDVRLDEVNIFLPEELGELQAGLYATVFPEPAKHLLNYFYAAVDQNPEQIALRFKDQKITYRELDRVTNQLAHRLTALGVGLESIVGLMTERSPYIVIGMLAILKAGGAYLPIDPEYPEERVKYILEDCKAQVMVTEAHLKEKVKYSCTLLDIKDESIYAGDLPRLEPLHSMNNLVNVFYTSGSTGKPKGVLVEYRGFMNYLNWCIHALEYTPEDVTLQLISFAFDGFAANLYPTLLTGGTVVLLDEKESMDFGIVKEVIEIMQVTNMSVVPSMYQALLNNCQKGALASLRFVVLAGEKAKNALLSMSNEINPAIKLVNAYGPTENSVTTTSYLGMEPAQPVRIGKPIFNNQVYIMSENRTLLPQGVVGELCVSGIGLARGYLNRPELSAEKFYNHPVIGKRIYRTGDLARFTSDGNLEFVGRIDQQVKIRGLRIELGEIENLLLDIDVIKEAVVIKREDTNGRESLCAYIVLEKGWNQSQSEVSIAQLRRYLLQFLPDYMLPDRFDALDRLPLSPNGKVDLNKLPAPDGSIQTGVKYVAPGTETERKLAKIWADVLGADVEKIGIKDSFFDLGGNSLSMMELTSVINKEFEMNLKITDIFKYNTIEQITALMEAGTVKEQQIVKFKM